MFDINRAEDLIMIEIEINIFLLLIFEGYLLT